MTPPLLEAFHRYREAGIEDQVDYQKFRLYSIITHSTAIEGSTITELENQLLFDEASAVSPHDIELVKNLGFKTSATTNHGLISRKTDPLELPRLFVTERNWKEVIDYIADNC